MGEYTDAIERINIELSLRNKLKLLDELDEPSREAICRCITRTTGKPWPDLELAQNAALAGAQNC